MTLFMVSENLLDNLEYQKSINGITVSPKKNFCIIKLWFNENIDNKSNIIINNEIKELESFEGIFKKHI